MDESTIEADYLIMGGGASAMAFADSLLTESNATMVIVDRHHRPGGHWNDAYPFVRLHQPSSSYGVNSAPLGFGAIDEIGLNIGFEELASGQEVLSHYDRVMRQRFLPSGRVRWFPTCELVDDDVIKSRGEKVAPKEVENVLVGIPGVKESAVIGVPDEILGEAVKAIVVLEQGVTLTEKEIQRECQTRLESFMVPKFVQFVSDLPKTDTGKIKKTGLA